MNGNDEEDNYHLGVELLKNEFRRRGIAPPLPELPSNYHPPERYNYGKPVRLADDGSVASTFRRYGQG